MSEIFVEEENTVYELDPECLKRKEEQKKMEEQKKTKNEKKYKVQKISRNQNLPVLWILCLLFFVNR